MRAPQYTYTCGWYPIQFKAPHKINVDTYGDPIQKVDTSILRDTFVVTIFFLLGWWGALIHSFDDESHDVFLSGNGQVLVQERP